MTQHNSTRTKHSREHLGEHARTEQSPDDDSRFLTREACEALARRTIGYAQGGGSTRVWIVSEWTGELRWARNAVAAASDRRTTELGVFRENQDCRAISATNQIDPRSLQKAVANTERRIILRRPNGDTSDDPMPPHQYSKPIIWSETTNAQPDAVRTEACRAVLALVKEAKMLTAGYLGVTAGAKAHIHSNGISLYARYTKAQCSLTVRNPTGTGSGWAGASSYDWARIDPVALARIAIDKCLTSQDPVRVEPGRYMVILEPQATCDLVKFLIEEVDRRWTHELSEGNFGSPFSSRPGYSKLGQRLIDERITLEHDPADPRLGVLPFANRWEGLQPYRAVKWFDRGVLTALGDDIRDYVVTSRLENSGNPNSHSFRMSGGETSTEEMITTTKRGILVTRFSGMDMVHRPSLLLGGYTRDGLWLIENGKISKTIKNFRFVESPLFVLNNIEQLGVPVPVFSPGEPALVPPIKVRDFSFTSLSDAV